jgi:hypothetical protein
MQFQIRGIAFDRGGTPGRTAGLPAEFLRSSAGEVYSLARSLDTPKSPGMQ